MSNVLVFVEHTGSAVKKGSLGAITAGRQLAEKAGGELHLALIGKDLGAVTEELKGYGAKTLHVVDGDAFENYVVEAYAPALVAVLEAAGAKTLVGATSSTSKDLFPRLSARLDAAMASDIMEVVDAKSFKRGMWAGNVIATVELTTDVKVITVRSTEFAPPEKGGDAAVNAVDVSVDPSAFKATFVSLKAVKSERPDVTTAARVVAGGRGVKNQEGFDVIYKLADKLGAGVGASRAVCDAGWVPNDFQIGQTGKVVAPDLYFAIGISGAIQHVAGIKGSKTIVAINKDADAPIFQVSDYGVVDDLFKVVPELVEKL